MVILQEQDSGSSARGSSQAEHKREQKSRKALGKGYARTVLEDGFPSLDWDVHQCISPREGEGRTSLHPIRPRV